jgi:hypothetical protein
MTRAGFQNPQCIGQPVAFVRGERELTSLGVTALLRLCAVYM